MEIRIEDYALPRMKALLYQRKIRPTTIILITITMTKRTTITRKKNNNNTKNIVSPTQIKGNNNDNGKEHESDPDHFILHVGTNYFKSEKSSEFIAESIIDLAVSLKNEKRDISISNTIVRADNQELTKKAAKVDKSVSEFC